MLVLSRTLNESIMVGDDVRITVVDVRGDKVKLGIEAPKDTPVHRLEVYAAIKREKRAKVAGEHCDRCDGCGWYEGGASLKTVCEACSGTGVVKKGGASG